VFQCLGFNVQESSCKTHGYFSLSDDDRSVLSSNSNRGDSSSGDSLEGIFDLVKL
jgi:hypothetical protein